ncbi:MAG: response regulator [Acidimicrobiales bacterium]
MSTDTIHIFLVDDHEVVRRGLVQLLESETDLTVVGEAGSVAEALDRVPKSGADVAVLDVRLPDGNGVELCRDLRSACPDLSCLMLTSFADDDALLSAVVAGASGYVLKQVRGIDLVDSVRKTAAGARLFDPADLARVAELATSAAAHTDVADASGNSGGGGADEDDRIGHLTPQERRILDLMADGLTNRQIGEQLYLAEKTVKNYVSNLLAKMGFSRRTEAAVYAARFLDHGGHITE